MMTQVALAAVIGGWEVGVIFGLLLILVLVISAVVGILRLIGRATRKKPSTPSPPLLDQASPPVSRAWRWRSSFRVDGHRRPDHALGPEGKGEGS